jgi:glycosyltransferase involved in cell wall biosynthesis
MVPSLPLSRLSVKNPLHWLLIVMVLRSGQRRVEKVSRETKVDHIIALWSLPSGYWARNILKRYGIPYGIWALGSDIWTLGKLPIVKNILALVLRDSSFCFADGMKLKEDVERISGRSCGFLASVRKLPVKKKKLSSTPPYRLAFLGRWHRNKGVDLLIESLQMLGDEDWKKIKEVRICGGGPMEKIVRSGCEALKKAGRPVRVEGYLGREAAADLLNWADYLLLPSRIESIPVVFSDAMQAGCPVIATPVGDLPRLVEKYQVGMISEELSSNAFSETLASALNNPPSSYFSGLAACRGNFNVQHTVERLLGAIGYSDFSEGGRNL